MIPKIIHYCWFGGAEKSELIQKCINSWKKRCPEYEIIEWNENNFDINTIQYIKEAYEAKKWAFVSDVVRLIVLIRYGGIYLDTDVKILEDNVFDQYLLYKNVLVFDNERSIASGLFCASIKNSELLESFLECYKNIHFDCKKMKTNTAMNKPVIKKYFPTLKWNAETQIINNTYIMSPGEYNLIMKHYGTRSWLENNPGYVVTKDNKLKKILRSPKIFECLDRTKLGRKVIPIYEFISYDLLDLGVLYYIRRIILKIKNE